MHYGFLGWLSDLGPWARGIRAVLRPWGRLVLVEFHPVVFGFDAERRLVEDIAGGVVIRNPDGVADYVGNSVGGLLHDAPDAAVVPERFVNPHPTAEFAWGLGELLDALLTAGLRVVHVREYLHSNGHRAFPDMLALPGGRWAMPPGAPRMPLMLSVVAER